MNLCTLQQLKQYLSITETDSDAILSALITAYSKRIERYCSRTFSSTAHTEVRNGNGQSRLILRQWPVTAVASVASCGRAIPHAASFSAAGWRNVDGVEEGDGKVLVLSGYAFDRGNATVQVSYTAGYAPAAIANEQWNIPATPYQVTILGSLGFIPASDSIKFVIGGAALTRVAGNPATGQYAISAAGVVTFAAADTGLGVYISYSVSGIPEDLQQACIELAALRYKAKDWIGYNSKTLAGESVSVSFNTRDMPASVQATLAFYSAQFVPA